MASASDSKILKKAIIKKKPASTTPAMIVSDDASQNASEKEMLPKKELATNNDIQDNYVSSRWRAAPAVCHFLIQNAYCAMLSHRANIIFSPFPTSWISNSSAVSSIASATTNIDIKQLVKENNIITNFNTVITAVRDSYNDAEILERLNANTYELLKFILEGNKMLLKADNLLSSNDIIQVQAENHSLVEMEKFKNIVKHIKEKDIKEKDILDAVKQFKVEHTALVEDRFRGRDTIYLYHGSRAENWYSILANGIKIGSKSKYFLNGAAYGNGIYLSNDINLSLGYSGRFSDKDNTEGANMILAIFQVINNPRWYMGGTVFVVDDENALVLRYLLVFNDMQNLLVQGIIKAINIKLNSGGIEITEKQKQEMASRNITTIHNKRLMREYQAIIKQSPATLGFQVRLAEEDQLGKWIILLDRVDNSRLEEQMRRLGIPAIEIEITFKESYPIEPPFIRVVYPHFKFHSGHITVGGSLCMEMLTNQGWSPTFNVENVITQIKMAISDGGGEIDEANYKKRYTMTEALQAFKRVMSAHGWV
jgi:ubiquitin-protein ligase